MKSKFIDDSVPIRFKDIINFLNTLITQYRNNNYPNGTVITKFEGKYVFKVIIQPIKRHTKYKDSFNISLMVKKKNGNLRIPYNLSISFSMRLGRGILDNYKLRSKEIRQILKKLHIHRDIKI